MKEEKEAKKILKNDKNLSSIILIRQQKRENVFNSFLDNLMEKYGNDDIINDQSSIPFNGIFVGKNKKKKFNRRLSKN